MVPGVGAVDGLIAQMRLKTGDPERAVLGGTVEGAPISFSRALAGKKMGRENGDRTQNTHDDEPVFTSHQSKLLVRLRHRAPLLRITLEENTLHFSAPIRRPAPGQSAVLYDGQICLGGGIII